MSNEQEFFLMDGSEFVLEEENIDSVSPLAAEAQVCCNIETHGQSLTITTGMQMYVCAASNGGSRQRVQVTGWTTYRAFS
jgi:hypothetical protein